MVYAQKQTTLIPLPPPASLVVAQAIDLKSQGVDALLVPDVQLGQESSNPEGVSPWLSDLGAALERLIPGLPTVLRVPAELSPEIAGLAAELGQALTRNPMVTRRAWQSTKYWLAQEWVKPVNPSANHPIGLVGQPYVLSCPEVLQTLQQAAQNLNLSLWQSELAPGKLREQGLHMAHLDLPSDQEVAGQARSLHNLGKVSALLLVTHPEIAPVPAVIKRWLAKSTKPSAVWELGQDPHTPLNLLATPLP